eukprot:183315-Prymnesium_polylepis.1
MSASLVGWNAGALRPAALAPAFSAGGLPTRAFCSAGRSRGGRCAAALSAATLCDGIALGPCDCASDSSSSDAGPASWSLVGRSARATDGARPLGFCGPASGSVPYAPPSSPMGSRAASVAFGRRGPD